MSGTEASAQGPRAMATRGPVLVIGSGLLGASLGLALRAGGVEVLLEDASPTSLRLAQDIGAGRPLSDWAADTGEQREAGPGLVVVATPPDVADRCVVHALRAYPRAFVTDVASVKDAVMSDALAELGRQGVAEAGARYVGSHPMAGRERSGAGAADADLFYGRPWVVVAHEGSSPEAVLAVRALASDVGGVPMEMTATMHDRSVALVSHVPQLVSSMLAARLGDAPPEALSLAGQGLRDTARIAASDPRLWTAILAGNAGPVAEVLRAIQRDLDDLVTHLDAAARLGPLRGGSVGAINRVMEAGNRGVARIPGKHGGAPRRYAEVQVLVPDSPGELGRLFSDVGAAGVNVEDFSMEHSPGQSAGLAMVSVLPAAAAHLEAALDARGWRVVVG